MAERQTEDSVLETQGSGMTLFQVRPNSDLEAASIASGIPPAALDIFYDSDDPARHAHEHSASYSSNKRNG